ncbi:TetR family transcriptional regulator [Mycobacterium talmoniae]|uniref:TetR family transcriptional regulator n=2 Tax=Mycobacterium talmoniae TaxID=1858794 RepID=A0A1S1NH21_9MYCO|nr:TetR family transcriptional regulator [Mycobacterium talmoniae]TDH51543.1 TetR/AcrR family transcriptional regulator [Mycobacterium eburneum]
MSISNDSSVDIGDRILAAAASCVAAFGVDRVTLAEIARRAGVSRPTVYRRWPDTRSVLAALLTARITGVLDEVPARGQGREALVDRVVALAQRLRADDLISAVLRSAPELAMVYIADRLGTSQQILIDALAADLRAAQRHGSVRAGDPRRLAAMCLLITQSTIQSAQIVAPILDDDALAAELRYALNGYLS